jgi:hypothetical protein
MKNAKPAKLICAEQKPSLGVASPPTSTQTTFFLFNTRKHFDCAPQPTVKNAIMSFGKLYSYSVRLTHPDLTL